MRAIEQKMADSVDTLQQGNPLFRYECKPPKGHIRLLEAVRTGSRNLGFRMMTSPRSDEVKYAAISYTWGSEDHTETIYLNGHPFPIRSNLWTCLYNLAGLGQQRNSRPSFLWVDAICINQQDIEEKAEQVREMDMTYRMASIVLVWLGPAPEVPLVPNPWPADDSGWLFRLSGLDYHLQVRELARREYWERMWVVQEFLLANDVWIHWIGGDLHWKQFERHLSRCSTYYNTGAQCPGCQAALELLDSTESPSTCSTAEFVPARNAKVSEGSEQEGPSSLGSNISALRLLAERTKRAPARNLAKCLLQHSESKCQDPRDRVFALLGLLEPTERQQLQRVFPDYSLSSEIVFIVALAHLANTDLWNRLQLNLRSSEIFEALGLANSTLAERQFLLGFAQDIDYLAPSFANSLAAFSAVVPRIESIMGGGTDSQGGKDTIQ